MSVRLPDVFYLDEPSDGASAHLLSTLGVKIHRKIGAIDTAVSAAGGHETHRAELAIDSHGWHSELKADYAITYFVVGGGAFVDVRDSADAWIRVVLREGDGVTIEGKAQRRIVQPTGEGFAVFIPPYPDNADRESKMCTVVHPPPCEPVGKAGSLHAIVPVGSTSAGLHRRFQPGSIEEREANRPHFTKPGTPHTRQVVVDLCESFYHLGWVTGTGGSISIRHGDRIFMAPSGVQKERMQPQDIFVLDTEGKELYSPMPLPGKPKLKLSQCAPLFHHAFILRNAGACIHTHDMNAVMATLMAGNESEFRITHQEMIKGVAGHGFNDTCVVPIIENTPHECDLADSMGDAMRLYPKSSAILVRRHGVYVWGSSWEQCKAQAECYHYLFEVAVRMRKVGLDPALVPARVENGIGAERSYGSGRENTGGYGSQRATITGAGAGSKRPLELTDGHVHAGGCCGGAHADASADGHSSKKAATSDGFHGSSGTGAMAIDLPASSSSAAAVLPGLSSYSQVVLDVEGCTTSIQFVTDTLFPYAAAHVKEWLTAHWGSEECKSDVAALVAQSADDLKASVDGASAVAVTSELLHATGAAVSSAINAIVANVQWQMSLNRKTGCLKQLQGHIWRDGYESGQLKGHLFEDTPAAIKAWVAAGKHVYIYSSGSREAQRLLFKYSVAGDLRPLISGYFDTKTGMKVEAGSYREIALSLGVDSPSKVLFATDALAEAVAASAAGMQVVVTDRPGNNPLQAGQPYPVATSLSQLTHLA